MTTSNKRTFLSIILVLIANVWAFANTPEAKKATAITQVYGDGVRMIAVALEYSKEVTASDFSVTDFSIEGRTITGIFTSNSMNLTDKADKGKYLIIQLSPDDANISLAYKMKMSNATTSTTPRQGGKKWVAGDKLSDNLAYKDAQAVVVQKSGKAITTSAVKNLIVDDFQQLTFKDPATGKTLRYNLFVPTNKGKEPLPLVLFMHDAGVTSEYHRATLFQGLGAVIWASPEEQAKRPCIVLAPQFDEIIVDDTSKASPMLETTIHLIENLSKQYNIDTNRLYTTGQSGGCMMSIAMNIKYPDFFAAAYLVAGQWNPDLVAPLANKKLWIMTSVDDLGAFPGENAITKRLEKEGAKVSRAWWNATWNANEYRFAYDKIVSEGNPIKYTAFEKGTVFLPGADTAGASGHRNTWRVAYSIEPIREWLFEQRK